MQPGLKTLTHLFSAAGVTSAQFKHLRGYLMHVVEVPRDGDDLAMPMSHMRDWLDVHDIEPKFFGFDARVFRLEFATAREAVFFARAFGVGGDRETLAA